MANDIVQTIAEARVDARSLSEFVFKPADFMVARRLAPSVRTLQYYVDFFNTLQSNIATSVSAAQSSLNNSVAEAQGKVAYIETTVQDAINQSILSSGFITIDSFELGATITQRNQALRHAADGRLYRWAGDLPKVVSASSTPTSSGGMGDNAWLEVSDITLRQDLANPNKGALMVRGAVNYVNSISDLQSLNTRALNDGKVAYLEDGRRSGHFGFYSSDLSAEVTSDPAQGIYIAPSSDPTGKTGAWVRSYSGPIISGWFGVSGSGLNETTSMQRFLDQGGDLYLQVPDTKYSVSGLMVREGSRLFIEPGTIIEAISGLPPAAILVRTESNVSILAYGATVRGIKSEYTTGEHRHGVSIRADNVTVEGLTVRDTGGDGFYIGGHSGNDLLAAINIKLINVSSINNRRQGITLASGKHILIDRPYIADINGTAPEAGIDIEPNYGYDLLEDIRIVNPTTVNTAGSGITINYVKATSAFVDISITGHTHIGSSLGFVVASHPGGATGRIKNSGLTYVGAGCQVRDYAQDAAKVIISNGLIKDWGFGGSLASPQYSSGIIVLKDTNDTAGRIIGNVHIEDIHFQQTLDLPYLPACIYIGDPLDPVGDNIKVRGITSTGPVHASGVRTLPNTIGVDIEDYEASKFVMDGNRTLSGARYARNVYHNTVVAMVAATLSSTPPVKIHNDMTNGMTVYPPSGGRILPGGAVGQGIQTKEVGAKIDITPLATGDCQITSKIGDWSFIEQPNPK